MVISAVKKQDTIYIDAHAEQSYTGSFLADKGDINTNISLGIYGQELTRETLININDYIQSSGKNLNLIIDFNSIKDVQSNQQRLIVEIKNSVNKLVLTNVTAEIISKLNIDLYPNNNVSDGLYRTFYVADQIEHIPIASIDELFEEEFIKRLKQNVIVSKASESYRHNSPIYIPKFVDIKGMMVSDTPFFIYLIYRLAMQMKVKVEWVNNILKPILFCQNLNGAFIASVLSSFLDWDILSMDHIGPVNKVYSNIGSKIKADARYIVISDMVCLGTEVRICQNIINYSGGQYIGNASVVRIDTLVPEHQTKDTVSVFHISKENNPIDYQILTALDI